MLNTVKNIMNERKAAQVEKALLSDDYYKDRDSIIQSIKESLKNKDYRAAKDFFDKYHNVAQNDTVFCALEKEARSRIIQYNELESLKTILEVTPKDDFPKIYELCNKILEKEPDNQDCLIEIIRCEQALGLRPVVANDLRLGRILTSDLIGYYDAKDSDIKIPQGGVTIRLHTHGVSIKHSNGIYRIHYSQLISLEYNSEGAVSSLFAMAAGAIVGGLIAGGTGALVGAGTVADLVDSKDVLNILYWDIESDCRKLITIKCKNEKVIHEFINKYNCEIEITKRTKREPKSEINYVKRLCIILGIIISIITLPTLCSDPVANNSSNNNAPSPTDQSQPSYILTEQITDSVVWVNHSPSSCSFNQSGTTLTVSGTKASEATIEISGISTNECKTVDIAFDNQTPKSVKCSLNEGKIKIESDRRMIKNMRGSANMKVTVPLDNGDGKIIQYSLAGFSKACEWTK